MKPALQQSAHGPISNIILGLAARSRSSNTPELSHSLADVLLLSLTHFSVRPWGMLEGADVRHGLFSFLWVSHSRHHQQLRVLHDTSWSSELWSVSACQGLRSLGERLSGRLSRPTAGP